MKYQRLISTSLIAAIAASALSACQEKKQLSEMHDNTQQMNQTTTGMAANMEKTVATMDSMKKTTEKVSVTAETTVEQMGKVIENADKTVNLIGESYDAGRQGGALDLRNKIYEVLRSTATPLDKKIVEAAKYMVAFEFQLWSGQGQDIEGKTKTEALEKLEHDAVIELFNNLKTVSHWDADAIDPFAQPDLKAKSNFEEKNQKAIFNALAAALHKTNRKQDRQESLTVNKDDKTSMFTLIERALLAGQEIRTGNKRTTDFPAYVDEVLRNEQMAIRLLQARYNIIGIVLLARVTQISDSLWEGFKLKIWGSKWDLDLDNMNISQVKYYNDHFAEAKKTKDLLTRLGIKVEIDKNIKKIFSHMNIKDDKQALVAADKEDALVKEKISLVAAAKKYIGQAQE